MDSTSTLGLSEDSVLLVTDCALLLLLWYVWLGIGCIFYWVLLTILGLGTKHTRAEISSIQPAKIIKPGDPQQIVLQPALLKEDLYICLGPKERKKHELFEDRYKLFERKIALRDLLIHDTVTDRLSINNECVGVVRKTIGGRKANYDITDLRYDLQHEYLVIGPVDKRKTEQAI